MRHDRTQAFTALHDVGNALCPLGNSRAYRERRRNDRDGSLGQGLSTS